MARVSDRASRSPKGIERNLQLEQMLGRLTLENEFLKRLCRTPSRNKEKKRVLRMMRENDLLCRVRRRGVKTTNSSHSHPVFPNLIQDLLITSINQVWVSDITYIRLPTVFVYLAVILDLHSRRVIGYHLSRHLDTSLTLGAPASGDKRKRSCLRLYSPFRSRCPVCLL